VLYLVTGGAGFIGSYLVEYLAELGHEVVAVDDLSVGRRELVPCSDRVTFVKSKFQDVAASDFGEVQGIFHLAAQSSVPLSIEQPYSSSENNLASSLKALEVARLSRAPLVYASSSAVYGGLSIGSDQTDLVDIVSPYALDKWVMEKYARMANRIYDVRSLGMRFFNVYGPRQDPTNPYSGVIPLFISSLLKGNAVTLNGGHQTRDFIYVKDVVSIMMTGMNSLGDVGFQVVNVGSGTSVSILKLLRHICDIVGVEPQIVQRDLPDGDPTSSAGDYSKLIASLGIQVGELVGLVDGLRETVAYMKEHV
jgi:UDP-glucose 4-epimerase